MEGLMTAQDPSVIDKELARGRFTDEMLAEMQALVGTELRTELSVNHEYATRHAILRFTEGIGDPEPKSPGGFRGWADRVAEVLSARTDDFAYANLAVRGKLMQQIFDDQLEPALALGPDLITISAGGNNFPTSTPEPGTPLLGLTGLLVLWRMGPRGIAGARRVTEPYRHASLAKLGL